MSRSRKQEMASSKRKREPTIGNASRFSDPQRRFAASPVHHLPFQNLTPLAILNNGSLERRQDQGQHEAPTAGTEDDILDDMAEIVLAVDVKEKGTVGCCFYSASDERLKILSDAQLGGKEFVDMLKVEINPTTILTSTRAEEAAMSGVGSPDDAFRLPYRVHVRPSQEFDVENAKTKLGKLEIFKQDIGRVDFLVPGDGLTQQVEETIARNPGFSFDKGNVLRLGGILDIENTTSLGCAGALLTYIQRRKTIDYSCGENNIASCIIRSVETFFMEGTMYINMNTLASLQILQTESHPNAFNQGPGKTSSRAKEDFSLYGLFHQNLLTPQGKNCLKQYFLRPSIEINVIRQRHNLLDVLLLPVNSSSQQNMQRALRKVKNMRPVMTSLHKGFSIGKGAFGGFKGTIWSTLLNFATHTLELEEAIRELSWQNMIALRDKMLDVLDVTVLNEVGKLIYQTVDIEESQEQQRTIIKAGVDRELDLLKDRYNGLDGLLKQVAMDVASTIPESLQIEVNVIYFPQIGFSIAIPFDSAGKPAYCGNEETWEQVFTTENRTYFKDERMRELDENLGDIYGLICGQEIEIAYNIAQKVLACEEVLTACSDLCGELDCSLAMAKTAEMYQFTRPQMCPDNVIKIKAGRHPLQELSVASYIPNDANLRGGCGLEQFHSDVQNASQSQSDAPSMLLLTGPNFSGKSVYMKQIALIIYMAHIGSYVPAQHAEIGITDKILTRLSTPESMSKIQSTFMLDLQQVSLLLKFSTRRSLIIVDEFGKGTDIHDGAGLACGIFEYLLSLGDERPKVLAATHFHEIFENGFLPERRFLALRHMEVRIEEMISGAREEVTYLYNFKPGRSNQSFGTLCAAMNGVDSAIVARANELVSLSAQGQDLVAACAKVSKKEEAILKQAELIARSFLNVDLATQNRKDIKQNLAYLLAGVSITAA